MEQKTKDLAFGDVPKLIKELQQRNADLTLQAKTCRSTASLARVHRRGVPVGSCRYR